jgi:N-acetyl-alpha-D-glucosaminyl L-malate synthase BshA
LDKIQKDENTPCQRSVMANANERIITHISNFRKVKRIPDIIKIFHAIQKEIPSKLMMVGDGPEKEKAEQLCQELGILDKVIFFGNSNEIDKILCQTDLFLLPSKTESFGLVALEAMACGVPVISSNAGGLPEVNKDGFSGYLSEVGDIQGMAENAITILKNDDVLAEFKINALATAQEFDMKKILPLYEDLYRRAIAKYS